MTLPSALFVFLIATTATSAIAQRKHAVAPATPVQIPPASQEPVVINEIIPLCPPEDPDTFVGPTTSNPAEVIFNTGVSHGKAVGDYIRQQANSVVGTCSEKFEYATTATLDGMVVGQLGFGGNVASNKRPFYESRYNMITWNLKVNSGCNYDLFVEYAYGTSEERPAVVLLNGALHQQLKDFAFVPAGGWCPKQQRWVRLARFRTETETLLVQIYRTKDPLPNIRAVKLEVVHAKQP